MIVKKAPHSVKINLLLRNAPSVQSKYFTYDNSVYYFLILQVKNQLDLFVNLRGICYEICDEIVIAGNQD